MVWSALGVVARSGLCLGACLASSGCITNTNSNTNTSTAAQLLSAGNGAAARPVAPPPRPAMTSTAQIASARLVTVDKTTSSGSVLILASPQALARDCSAMGQVNVKVVSQPANGTVQVEPGMAFPNYVPGDANYRCNDVKSPAMVITYRSSASFTGQDAASVQIFFPDGRAPVIEFHITVR